MQTPVLLLLLGSTVCLLHLTSAGRQCRRNVEAPYTQWPYWRVPNPQSSDRVKQLTCCNRNTSAVCDPNGLMSEAQGRQLDILINEVYDDTRCGCKECYGNNHGYIIRVAVVESMQRVNPEGGNTTLDRLYDTKLYSYGMSQQWDMNGDCNESLVILFSKQDGILFTLTKQQINLEQNLTPSKITEVSMAVRHYFDNDATIAVGLTEMINRYRRILSNDESLRPAGTRITRARG